MKRLALLAPEVPSLSATFVYREVEALRGMGITVGVHSMHKVLVESLPTEAQAHAPGVTTLYSRPLRVLSEAIRFAFSHPVGCARVWTRVLRDLVRGEFKDLRQRCVLPAQAVAAMALAQRLVSEGSEHLHVHFAHSPATVGMYAAAFAGLEFSVTSHANDLFVEASLLREKVTRARPFLTISEANRDFLRHELGEIAESVELARCGADLSTFQVRTSAPVGPPLVVAVGRMVAKKGFDLLVEAIANVRLELPDVRLVLVGDGPEACNLRKQADDLGVGQHVTFTGAVGREEIDRLLGIAHAFVLPCRRDPSGDLDGIPVVLMEAMARGVPVLSTRISGIPELVRDGDTGWIVEPEDVEALGRALSLLLSQPNESSRRATLGREVVEREFDLAGNARRLAMNIGCIGLSQDLTYGPLDQLSNLMEPQI